MGYYVARGDFFGDLWGGLTDVVSFAAPIVGAIAAPFTGGASLAIGAAVGAGARAVHGVFRGGPQTSPPGASSPIPESTGYAPVGRIARAPRAVRARAVRTRRGRAGRLGRSRQMLVPETAPPTVAPSVGIHVGPLAARLSDPTGGTMTMPGTEIHIAVTDPSPIQTYDQVVQTVPEFGGGGGGRVQTF